MKVRCCLITPRVAGACSCAVFGPWTYNRRLNVLTHRQVPGYEIDLDCMTTSAQVLDWIFQVTNKTWVSLEDAGYLIEAIRVLVDPQANPLFRRARAEHHGTEADAVRPGALSR